MYRPSIGGGPLNVAVGVARLGGDARFVGSLGDDEWGARMVTCGGQGAVLAAGGEAVTLPAPAVAAVDATGRR